MRSAVSPTQVSPSRRSPFAIVIAAAVGSIVAVGAAIMLAGSNGSREPAASPGSPSPSSVPALDHGLLVIDPMTGTEIARHPGTFGTSAFLASDLLAAGNGAMWTTEQTQVLKLDPSTGEAKPVPEANCTFDAISTGLGSTWVVCPGSTIGTVVEIDPFELSGRDIAMPGNLGATSGIGTGGRPCRIAASAFLVRVDQLDRRAGLIEGVTADDVAVDRQGVWVVDELAATVTRLDPATGEPLERFEVAGEIDDVAAGLGSVWVLDGGAGTVTSVDAETGEAADPIGVGPGASSMSTGFGPLWVCVPDEQRLVRVDPSGSSLLVHVSPSNRSNERSRQYSAFRASTSNRSRTACSPVKGVEEARYGPRNHRGLLFRGCGLVRSRPAARVTAFTRHRREGNRSRQGERSELLVANPRS